MSYFTAKGRGMRREGAGCGGRGGVKEGREGEGRTATSFFTL